MPSRGARWLAVAAILAGACDGPPRLPEGPSPRDENKQTVLAKPIDKGHRFAMWVDEKSAVGAAASTRSVEISE